MRKMLLAMALLVPLALPSSAEAFCGFYVSGAGAKLFNNATQVVLMRHGTRTVLSMQNNYQGPPENFAMVVPVPVVLQKENVKTLDKKIFDRIDKLAAPRLVEYWEQDPCRRSRRYNEMARPTAAARGGMRPGKSAAKKDLGVTIEAQFTVGEYEIVILSAKDSTGLDTWLRREKYEIPAGAEPMLRPYVESGSKFFVAKVDVKKVKFEGNQVTLSPLRFHYDSKEFRLPIRLGMINAKDKQDLIVHILAPGKRYHVANYKNAFIPTNLNVAPEARKRFGEFYAALFDRTLEKNKGAVVTEYSWDASTCDPCPTPALRPRELATLGADVLYQTAETKKPTKPAPAAGAPSVPGRMRRPSMPMPPRRPPMRRWGRSFVLTRLHARYDKGSIKDDLVFTEAKPMAGGREWRRKGSLEQGAQPSGRNQFQARYAIRHEWTGPIECENPRRGVWGGPPPGVRRGGTQPALNLAFAPRGKLQLASMVRQAVPELGVAAPPAPTATPKGGANKGGPLGKEGNKDGKKDGKKGCGCQSDGGAGGLGALFALIGLFALRRKTS